MRQISPPTVADLRCEHRVDPLGLETTAPRLSWRLASSVRGARQSAYQVIVASNPRILTRRQGDLWDSGRVASDATHEIPYAGKPLASHADCWWRVRVWDERGRPTPWSAPARWSMGVLDPTLWPGHWIGHTPPPEPVDGAREPLDAAQWIWADEGALDPKSQAPAGTRWLRRTIEVPPGRRAMARITADNRFALLVDGKPAAQSQGDGESWRRPVDADLTALLTPGTHTLTLRVTNDAPGPAGAILVLTLEPQEDGKALIVVTDGAWEGAASEGGPWRPAKVLAPFGSEPWGRIGAARDWAQTTPSPILRREFVVARKPLRSATIYIAGLGFHELRLNGRKVGDRVLDSPFTRYDRRVLYTTHDVTKQVTPGANALGILLGNGWYNQHAPDAWNFETAPWRAEPVARLWLRLVYEDGTVQSVATNRSWTAAAGPLLRDGLRNGEIYDARRERTGWDSAAFDASGWKSADERPGPKGTLHASVADPIRVIETIKPVKWSQPKPGVWVADMGQAFAGWARLSVAGPAGTRVTMVYGERLLPDGTVQQEGIDTFTRRGPFQTDCYVLREGGAQSWEPRFTFHGYRYVEVRGLPSPPGPVTLEGRVVHTDFASVGAFACSDPLLSAIQRLTLWSYRSNFVGFPTDCPHREKNGWTGDAHLAAEQGMLNWGNVPAYEKWLRDFDDEQRPSGALPGIIPTAGWGYDWGNGPAWDSAYLLIPWYLWRYKGDRRVLAEHYEGMKRYVDYLTGRAKGGIVDIGLGDWVPARTETPVAVTSTAYYAIDAQIVADAAKVLGKDTDAARYAALAREIRAAFHRAFYRGDGVYANGSQTALSCALYQQMAPDSERPAVLRQLAAAVARADDHIDTGILGAKYLFHALTDGGLGELAMTVATQKSAPGYGWWVGQGATTLWEDWPGASSRNHIMFGDISAWFYQTLAGIRLDPETPAFRRFVLKPLPLGGLTWVRAHHDAPDGRIVSAWRRGADRFEWEVTVPPNTSATVWVPADDPKSVQSDLPLLRAEPGWALYDAPAGSYRFRAKWYNRR